MVTLPFHPLDVRAREHKVYRLFAIDLATHHIPAFTRPKVNHEGGYDYPLRDALGVSALDDAHVQILNLSDLGELGLTGYMRDGLGIAEADLAEHMERLDGLEGHIAVVASAAFEGAATITPKPPVSLVGAFAEHEAVGGFPELASEATVLGGTFADPLPVPPVAKPWRLWLQRLWIVLSVLIIGYTIYFAFFSGEVP